MGRLSYLIIILALVVLCVLPLYCELKNEETLNFNLMEETNDVPEAMRIKRGIQIFNTRGDSSLGLHELKQLKKEKRAIKQKAGDSKTAKRKNEKKPQGREGKQRNLHKISVKQGNAPDTDPKKSVSKKNKKSMGNKKSQPSIDDRKNKQKLVPLEKKNDKRAARKMIKSERKNKKSQGTAIELNASLDYKSNPKKRELGITNKTVNELEKNSLDKTSLSSDSDNNQEAKDDKACVDENGPVKVIDKTKDNKEKSNVPAFDYFKTFPRSDKAVGANDTILSGKNSKNNSKQNSITKHIDEDEEKSKEDDDDKQMKIDASSDKMKHKNGNKKYNSKNHKKAILQDKKSPKNKVARVKKTKLSRKKPKH